MKINSNFISRFWSFLTAVILVICLIFQAIPSIALSGSESDELILLDDESDEKLSGTGFCAALSEEQAKVGSKSFRCTPGSGNAEYWIMRGNFPTAKNISTITAQGTSGALRFWIYVEDASTVVNWNGSLIELGAGWDSNVYAWDFCSQILRRLQPITYIPKKKLFAILRKRLISSKNTPRNI